mgnify:CR=1 FL=1
MRRGLWLCYALSGAAALALEMLWMRSAALVLGGGPGTTSIVLAWYFAGLGLGSALGRHGSPRPLRALRAARRSAPRSASIWSLAAFRGLGTDAAQAWLEGGLLRSIAALGVATLPATLCLGGTLPAIGQALVTVPRLGSRGGWLYAVNTFGGAVGLVLAGFGLPAAIGVRASYVIGRARERHRGRCRPRPEPS